MNWKNFFKPNWTKIGITILAFLPIIMLQYFLRFLAIGNFEIIVIMALSFLTFIIVGLSIINMKPTFYPDFTGGVIFLILILPSLLIFRGCLITNKSMFPPCLFVLNIIYCYSVSCILTWIHNKVK